MTSASAENIAAAMRSLEDEVRGLMILASLATKLWDDFGPPVEMTDSSATYRYTLVDREEFEFILNNVADRAGRLKDRFNAAWRGEVLQ